MNKTSKPTWHTLYVIGAAGIALLFVVPMLNLSDDAQKAAFFMIAAALCGGMSLWISDNRDALETEEPSLKVRRPHAKGYYTLNPGAAPARTKINERS